MGGNSLLILSNLKTIKNSINKIHKSIKNLYIHVNLPSIIKQQQEQSSNGKIGTEPPVWGPLILKVYTDLYTWNPLVDVRILVNPFKGKNCGIERDIKVLYIDKMSVENSEIQKYYKFNGEPIILNEDDDENNLDSIMGNDGRTFDSVVLGGTFDRIHVGHKILLTQAALRAKRKVTVGVTDQNMLKNKVLPELILPIDQRINQVKEFLNEIDSTLEYDIVPIQDPYGPTKSDPDMNMIIVSAETNRGAEKINQIRKETNLKPLEIYSVEMLEITLDENEKYKDSKISSSNLRMDLLGTRIRKPKVHANLPKQPHIIGLTGGIASGKSKISQRFRELGAHILDCDKIAHEVYEPDQICYKRIIDYFGIEIIDPVTKKIDRTKLGPIVFSNKDQLEILNQIVWPEIAKEVRRRIQKIRKDNSNVKVVILEAAILLKAGWEAECHEIWGMIIPPEIAVKRIQERNQLSETEARKRIQSQIDNHVLVSKSDIIFSSEWSYEFTHIQAERAWNALMSELSGGKQIINNFVITVS